jgi:hypothetical protein
MRRGIRLLAAILLGLAAACGGGAPSPSELDTRNEICRSCRMTISDRTLASQLAERGEETLFFDDLGCLREHLAKNPRRPGQVAYVADHATGAWIPASRAVFRRCASLETPMASHLIALTVTQGQGPPTSGCTDVSPADIFGAAGPPERGSR